MANSNLWPGFFHGSPPKKWEENGEIASYRAQVESMKNKIKVNDVRQQVDTLNYLLRDTTLLNKLEEEVNSRLDNYNVELASSLAKRKGKSATAIIDYYGGLIGILNILNGNEDKMRSSSFNALDIKEKIEIYQKKYLKSRGDNFERFVGYVGNNTVESLVNTNVNSLLSSFSENLQGKTQRKYSKSFISEDSNIDLSDFNKGVNQKFILKDLDNGNGQELTILYQSNQKVDILLTEKMPDGEIISNKESLKNRSSKIADMNLMNELSRWQESAAKWYALSFRSKLKPKIYEQDTLYIMGIHALIGQEDSDNFDIESNANILIYVSNDKENPIKFLNLNNPNLSSDNFYLAKGWGNTFYLSSLAGIGYSATDMNNFLKTSFSVHLKNLQNLT